MAKRRKGKRVDTSDGVRVFGKNANGDGSVYQQADGRWCATWWVLGEKRPRRATGKTQDEAIKRREKRRRTTGPDPSALRRIDALADWWLHKVHKPAVRPSSWSKARDRVRRIKDTLGHLDVDQLDYRVVTEWQAALSLELAPRTVRVHRQVFAQIVDQAVQMGLVIGNPVRSVDPPKVAPSNAPALEQPEVAALLGAVWNHRLAAAVALLFLQGWRISEVLGLAWEDLDLVAGTAKVRRAAVYVDGQGQVLGLTKTDEAQGEHVLMPTVVELLRRRRALQEEEKATAPLWHEVTYEKRVVGLVFTTPTGGLVLRQTVAKVITQAAKTANIKASISTHTGRRSVITTLWVEGGESLEDIAKLVGHADPSTTKGYVKRLGRRPREVAERAAALLDPERDPTGLLDPT